MPIRRTADYFLGGKPFMLVRGQSKGRAWHRGGVSDAPSRRSDTDAKYGNLPDELDHPEVWDSWHDGYGHPYRRTGENTYHWGENIDARWPRQLVHCQVPQIAKATFSITASINGMLENISDIFDANLGVAPTPAAPSYLALMGFGGWVAGQPTATGFYFSFMHDHAGSGTVNYLHPVVTYGSYNYFGNTGATAFYGVGITLGADLTCNMPGYRFAVAGNQLWRAHGPDVDHAIYLQNCGNPAGVASAANWGATFNLGNRLSGIKDMIGFEDQLFASSEQGLFAGDQTGTFVNVLSGLAGQVHPDNGRDLTIWDNSVIYQHIAGVFAFQPEGNVENISPPTAHRSPIQGRVRTVKAYGRELLAGLYTGSQSYLLSGHNNRGQITWHTLHRFPHTAKISRLVVDGITSGTAGVILPNRMWAAMDASIDTSGTAPLYWWPIPSLDGNPLAPSPAFSANYIGSARIDLGNVDGGAPSTPKNYRAVEVWADMLLSGVRYCDVYYDLDQSGSFALLGRAQTSPKSVVYFPSGTGTFISGQSIELSLRSFTASPALTPIYRSVVMRYNLLPRNVETITAVTRIADNMRDRSGTPMRSGATQIQELRGFVGTVPTELQDIAGATGWVKVLRVEENEMYQTGGDEPEIAATVTMAVQTFSGA